ncbi:DNA adenine methylase [Gleimia hominis]|uniref:site-specific DNA-methyltransferase (adenine-specific) n=1 Tax=Gleimia hominis TaxID=595468 RepID=A0ABU3ICU7_9ACTO|nr:DNA adenine methylase [Gleimia hominis]MDT3768196.1 DNA adenine methylase [Gleimia hominis]
MRKVLSQSAVDDEEGALQSALVWAKEGIKYTGSKQKLLRPIFEITKNVARDTVLDLFSGTTRVSRLFAGMGSTVTSNDCSVWSSCFATAYLLNKNEGAEYTELINHLNNLKPISGWFTENYGGVDNHGSAVQDSGRKALWQLHNSMKLDAIREEIDRLSLSRVERAIALTSLIYALDQVENTIGHFAAYLKNWSPRSYKQIQLKVPNLEPQFKDHLVFQCDADELVSALLNTGKEYDMAYLDPPYGSNNEKMPPSRVRYASYYHIWKTVILNDKPDVFGAARRREDSRDTVSASQFEEFRRNSEGKSLALSALDSVIRKTPAKYILLSYSNGGRATYSELLEILSANGALVKSAQIEYKRNVMANMTWTNEWTPPLDTPNIEYLFLLRK